MANWFLRPTEPRVQGVSLKKTIFFHPSRAQAQSCATQYRQVHKISTYRSIPSFLRFSHHTFMMPFLVVVNLFLICSTHHVPLSFYQNTSIRPQCHSLRHFSSNKTCFSEMFCPLLIQKIRTHFQQIARCFTNYRRAHARFACSRIKNCQYSRPPMFTSRFALRLCLFSCIVHKFPSSYHADPTKFFWAHPVLTED